MSNSLLMFLFDYTSSNGEGEFYGESKWIFSIANAAASVAEPCGIACQTKIFR